MSETVIRVENLGKRYVVGKVFKPANTLLGRARQLAHAPFNWFTQQIKGPDPDQILWALKDVSFEVKRADVVGIIGRNGAGKSTLLKILSRITDPTEGFAEIKGRVGSLLEVGTGMHPELTGRENIYMNATLLGMTRKEVNAKFDEIVDFSGIEKFLDTPVKRYSSGMHVRLGFAIAAHLEPEILIVDEVLAVGDLSFQNKCIGKMDSIASKGITVLFVSHNMGAIQRLCGSGILIDGGRMSAYGLVDDIMDRYLKRSISSTLIWQREVAAFLPACIKSVLLCDHEGNSINYITTQTPVAVAIEVNLSEYCRDLQLSVGLLDSNGDQIFGSAPQDAHLNPPDQAGHYLSIMYLPSEILMSGTYGIKVVLWRPQGGVIDSVDDIQFNVEAAASFANNTPGGRQGIIALRCNWTIEKKS
ncbi:MAG: ABC transporter ATP-binding protein [Desulfobacterales bacterium]|nr:ABC transporter ATP-binding protein [Desulfobacterales bacterium]